MNKTLALISEHLVLQIIDADEICKQFIIPILILVLLHNFFGNSLTLFYLSKIIVLANALYLLTLVKYT